MFLNAFATCHTGETPERNQFREIMLIFLVLTSSDNYEVYIIGCSKLISIKTNILKSSCPLLRITKSEFESVSILGSLSSLIIQVQFALLYSERCLTESWLHWHSCLAIFYIYILCALCTSLTHDSYTQPQRVRATFAKQNNNENVSEKDYRTVYTSILLDGHNSSHLSIL